MLAGELPYFDCGKLRPGTVMAVACPASKTAFRTGKFGAYLLQGLLVGRLR